MVTNWSSRAYSRTISACQPMKSVVSDAWKRRHASAYCGCRLRPESTGRPRWRAGATSRSAPTASLISSTEPYMPAQVVDEPLENLWLWKISLPGSLSTWNPITAGCSA